MDPIVEFAVKKIAGKGASAIEGGSGPIGWAIMGTQAIYAVVDHLSEEARDQARKVIGCNHLVRALPWLGRYYQSNNRVCP